MSKTKTLFTMALLVLLGSMGAAQAQNFAHVNRAGLPNPNPPPGWVAESEMSGSIWLTFSTGAAAGEVTVTLKYSVPLADDIPRLRARCSQASRPM